MRNASSAAENSSTALPLVELILSEYEALEDRGHSELDHSALWLWYQSQDGPAG
jgi:3-hydroxyisobutyrate dehydrogenase-like beta-hydroxyacid dehydrogenase